MHIWKGKRRRISGIAHHLTGRNHNFPAPLFHLRNWWLREMIVLGQPKEEMSAGCNYMEICSAEEWLVSV